MAIELTPEGIPLRHCPHCEDCKIETPYWCLNCGEQGLPSIKEEELCLVCREPAVEQDGPWNEIR